MASNVGSVQADLVSHSPSEVEQGSEAEETSEVEETFWGLAKNGTAAWGHEPSVEEITGYWQGLLAETRDDAEELGSEVVAHPGGEGWDEGGAYYEDEPYGDEWAMPRPEPPPWEPPEVVDWHVLPVSDHQVPSAEQVFGWWYAAGVESDALDLQPSRDHWAGRDDSAEVWFGPDPTPEGVGWLGVSLQAPDPKDLRTAGKRAEPEPWEPPEVVDWVPLPSGDELSPAEQVQDWWAASDAEDVAEDGLPDGVPGGGRARDTGPPDPWSGPDPTPEAVGWIKVSLRATAPEPEDRSEDGALDEVDATRLVGLAGGGLAYAGALATLERRRRVQVSHRRSGQPVPLPAAPLDAYERELRQGVDADAANLVDLALRAAAASVGATGLPRLALVEATSDQVRVAVPASRMEPVPEGFTRLGHHHRYGWATVASPDELSSLAAPALPPIPALVPMGLTDEGGELLVDLEAVGVVSVDGSPTEVIGLLRSGALVLATAAWSESLRVVVVGLERELQDLTDVIHVGNLQDALTLAEDHTERVAAALESQGHGHTGAARAALAPNEAHDVLAVVSALAPQDEETWQRVMAVAANRRRGVGLLVPNLVPAGLKMAEVGRLDAERGTLRIPGVLAARAVTPRRLDAVDLRGLMGLLASATRRDSDASSFHPHQRGGGSDVIVDLTEHGEDGEQAGQAVRAETLAEGEVLVRVLGEVEAVLGEDGSERPLEPEVPGALELLAYLALRGSPVTDGTIEVNLFPDGAKAVNVTDLVAEVRRLLGPDVVYRWATGRFALAERVFTDYGCFCDLVARAEVTTDRDEAVDLLSAALELVTSMPLDGVGQQYPWAGPQRLVMVAHVLDAADALAELLAGQHEWLTLEWAAHQGLKVAPADERMHRWLMRAAHARGDTDRIHELFASMCDLAADPVVGIEPEDTVQPETMQLMERLLSQAPPPARHGLPNAPAAAETTELPQVDEELPVTREVPQVGPDAAEAGANPVLMARRR